MSVTRKRVAAGRKDAARWELERDGAWIGDLVHWKAEGEWEFQPPGTTSECITGKSEVEVILKAGLAS